MPSKISKFDIKFFPLLFIPLSIIIGQAALSITIFFSILIFLFNIKNLNFNINLQNFFFISFFFILIVSTKINNNLDKTNFTILLNSFLYLKFLILYILINSIEITDKTYLTIKNIFLITLVCLVFVLIDTIFQYQNPEKKDLFGYMATGQNANRLTGPFGSNEAIPGSFLIKICFICLIFVNLISILSTKINKKILLSFVSILNILFFITILLSGERIAFMMSILSLLIFVFFIKKFKKFFFLSGLITLISLSLIIISNDYIKNRYQILGKFLLSKNYLSGDVIEINKLKDNDFSKKNKINFFNNQWGAHYLTSIEIFKDNIFFGSGIKGFRNNCNNQKYENIQSLSYYKRCSSHSHNLYFEILSETGILGFISIFSFFLIITFKSIKLIIKLNSKKLSVKDEIYLGCFIGSIAVMLSILWPIRSSGSFFSNMNGSMIWYNIFWVIIFLNYFDKKIKLYR